MYVAAVPFCSEAGSAYNAVIMQIEVDRVGGKYWIGSDGCKNIDTCVFRVHCMHASSALQGQGNLIKHQK